MLHWKHDRISLKADAYRGSSYILPIEPKLVARAIHAAIEIFIVANEKQHDATERDVQMGHRASATKEGP